MSFVLVGQYRDTVPAVVQKTKWHDTCDYYFILTSIKVSSRENLNTLRFDSFTLDFFVLKCNRFLHIIKILIKGSVMACNFFYFKVS